MLTAPGLPRRKRLAMTKTIRANSGWYASAKVLLPQSLTRLQRRVPVPAEFSPTLFEFAHVQNRAVVVSFDGG